MVEKLKQNIGPILQVGGLIFGFALLYAQAQTNSKAIVDHETRLRCMERTIYEMAADVKILAKAADKR